MGGLRAAGVLGWAGGLAFAFGAVLFSGFARVPGDLGDARLIHYLLEHGHRWLLGAPGHADLWSPPFFYPAPNAGAYTDILLSAVPFYTPWRLAGIAPDTSFQLWMLTVASLNYWGMYLFLRRCPRLPPVPSAAGAFLFAFAGPRLVHLPHLQLHVHVYTVVCLYSLYRLFEAAPASGGLTPPVSSPTGGLHPPLAGQGRWRGRLWLLAFIAAAVAQLYASFYLGWFLGLGLAVACGWALALAPWRRRLLAVLRAYPVTLGAGLALAAPALGWMARHYLAAAGQSGMYSYAEVSWALPNPAVWLCRGPDCWVGLTRGLVAVGVLPWDPWPGGECAVGIGPVTTALVLLGLYRGWASPLVRVLALTGGTLLTLFTVVAPPLTAEGGLPSPYYAVYHLVPAAGAVRAPIRVMFVLLVPAAVGLAYLLQSLTRGWVAAAVIAVCVLEQGRPTPSYDKHEARARVAEVVCEVRPGCRAFFVSRTVTEPTYLGGEDPFEKVPYPSWARPPRPPTQRAPQTHLDAMWAQLETGVPTVNGCSGGCPPGWDLDDNEEVAGRRSPRLEHELRAWLARNGVGWDEVCWVRLGDPP